MKLWTPRACGGLPARAEDDAAWLRRTVELLVLLLRAARPNPPGDERPVAQVLAGFGRCYGLAVSTLEVCPGRPHVLIELPGSAPDLPPLLLVTHGDVVPPGRPPAGTPAPGEVRDGFVWGRGALDALGPTATWAAVLAALAGEARRGGRRLLRTVRLVVAADEESGGNCGLGPLVERYPQLARAIAALGEGGGYLRHHGSRAYTAVVIGECGLAHVPAAIGELAAPAEVAVHAGVIGPTTRSFLEALAKALPWRRRRLLRGLLRSNVPLTTERMSRVAELAGIPVDALGRMLAPWPAAPDHQHTEAALRVPPDAAGAMAAWPTARWAWRPTASPTDHPVFAAIGAALAAETLAGGGSSLPLPVVSATRSDLRFLRAKGVPAYGFFPLAPNDDPGLMHGPLERISLAGLQRAFRLTRQLLRSLAAR